MKIVCVEPLGIAKEGFEQLKNEFSSQGHEFEYYMDRKEDPDTLVQRMRDAHVVVVSNIPL